MTALLVILGYFGFGHFVLWVRELRWGEPKGVRTALLASLTWFLFIPTFWECPPLCKKRDCKYHANAS